MILIFVLYIICSALICIAAVHRDPHNWGICMICIMLLVSPLMFVISMIAAIIEINTMKKN